MSRASDASKVYQSGNSATNMAARDVNVTNNYAGSPTSHLMARLLEAYRNEKAAGGQIATIIEELDYETKDRDRIGLEQKLAAAGYEDLAADAKVAKELFAKCLLKHNLHGSAQKIFAYLLGRTYSLHTTSLEPLIDNHVPSHALRKAIQSEVTEKLRQEFHDNDLELFPCHLEGMVYFLAGTCRTRWCPK
jgi:DNA helicase IV